MVISIQDILKNAETRRKLDKKRFENLDGFLCQVCGKSGNDRRSLFISCFYNLGEISELFIDLFDTEFKDHGWYLRICKGCRARFMTHLGQWIQEGGRLADSHLDEDGIYGYTREEWEDGKHENL